MSAVDGSIQSYHTCSAGDPSQAFGFADFYHNASQGSTTQHAGVRGANAYVNTNTRSGITPRTDA